MCMHYSEQIAALEARINVLEEEIDETDARNAEKMAVLEQQVMKMSEVVGEILWRENNRTTTRKGIFGWLKKSAN